MKRTSHAPLPTLYLLLCLLVYSGRIARADETLPRHLFGAQDTRAMTQWVDSVYRSLSTEQQLAQLIMPIIYPSAEAGRINAEEARVRRYGWGGILYQKGMLRDQATMNARLQQVSRTPMLIALDGEWGLYMRLKDAPRYPRNMGLGLHGDDQLIYNYGREVARQCRIMGIHINFAPTVDVNINPRNPVIGTRSFGEDPKQVARLSLAYAQGLEDGGVLSVAKHFPGHGDTSEDSHKTLPLVSASKRRMQEVELYPFEQYIRAGFGGIMTAHLRVPAFEPRAIPSSLSERITTQLLQDDMKFRGLIFTDGLEMKGVLGSNVGDVGVAALRAGNDILLGPANPEKQLTALASALDNGRLDPRSIERKVRKVLSYKWRLIVAQQDQQVSAERVSQAIHTDQAKRETRYLWRVSLHFLQENQALWRDLKQGLYRRIAVLQVGKAPASIGTTPSVGLGNSRISYLTWTPGLRLEEYDVILVNAFQPTHMPTDYIQHLSSSRPVIVAYYTSPYRIGAPAPWQRTCSAVVVAMEGAPEAQQAVLSLIAGDHAYEAPNHSSEQADSDDPTAGMTPVLPSAPATAVESRGAASQLQVAPVRQINRKRLAREIDSIVSEGIRSQAFPGCQIYVMHQGQEVYSQAFGTLTESVRGERVTPQSIYDVASITKALATTPAIMLLVADGKVDLKASISTYLPELRGSDIGAVSIRTLLWHQSGLPAGIPFYTDLIDSTSYTGALIRPKMFSGGIALGHGSWGNPEFRWLSQYVSSQPTESHPLTMASGLFVSRAFRSRMLERIAETKLRNPGRYRYSDLGFILLQQVAERVSGESLDTLLQRRVYSPIGAQVYFNPLQQGIAQALIAPTQHDRFLRKQVIRGTVDDESAACLGGVSGNAGLYASASELAKVAQLLLDRGQHNGRTIIPTGIVDLFMTSRGVGGRRALGFDRQTGLETTPTAEAASASTVGHLGFTGTAVWIDPEYQLVFVFLSNRTYPSRLNNRLSNERYRPRLHQAVYNALK